MISRACKQSLALFVCACVSHRVDYVTGMCIVPNFGGGGRNVAEELTRFWFLETWSHDPSSLAWRLCVSKKKCVPSANCTRHEFLQRPIHPDLMYSLSEKSQRDKRKQAVEGLIHHHAKTGNHNAMLIRAALVCGRSVRSIIPNDLKFESVAADRGFDFSRSVLERGTVKKYSPVVDLMYAGSFCWPLNKRRDGSRGEHVIRIESQHSRSCSNKPVERRVDCFKRAEWSVIFTGESGQTSLEL